MNRNLQIWNVAWFATCICFLVFLLAPLFILIAVSFNPVAMVFPPEGFTFKWYYSILERPEFLESAWSSTLLGLMTATVSTGFGVLAAIALQNYRGVLKAPISFLLMAPLFIPAVIVALALFQILYMAGIMNNIWILAAAHVVVTIPYPVRNVMAQLAGFDIQLEEAAMTVGATRRQALWRVTLPMMKASIIPSFIITFILSWNNYTISIFLANRHWTTLPLQLRAYLQYEYEPFVAAMSTVLIVVSIVLVVLVDRLFGFASDPRST